jgi:hypothetical protein
MVPKRDEQGQWWWGYQKVYMHVPPKEIQEQWTKDLMERNGCKEPKDYRG